MRSIEYNIICDSCPSTVLSIPQDTLEEAKDYAENKARGLGWLLIPVSESNPNEEDICPECQ